MTKNSAISSQGRYFEDFSLGQVIRHATPRTITTGDVSLYSALYGMRFALQSSDVFARECGLARAPVDDLLVFHIVFGKTVPDISINAVANLGYADCRFRAPVYPGDTVSATSRVIGLKQNSNGRTGNVYVQTTGNNQRGETVLEYVRWVMVNKGDAASPPPTTIIPDLAPVVVAQDLIIPENLQFRDYDSGLSGSDRFWQDYTVGDKINHSDGMTIEAADHTLATRLYQNTARVHFNLQVMKAGRLGERIIYGGHIISLARALSFNGLANAQNVLAINAGRHVNPAIAGDTIYAWSEILDKAEIGGQNSGRDGGRADMAALRIRLVALKDETAEDFCYKMDDGKYHPAVLLDMDVWLLVAKEPRR